MAKKDTPKDQGQVVPYDYSQDAGSGFENVKRDDLSIPFLVILQDGSPEVKKTHKDFLLKGIKGAQAGHIINTLTREILNKNIETDKVQFVPCFYTKLFVEWQPREKGGGIVQTHMDEAILARTTKNDKNQDVLPNGNIIATTAYFYGLLLTASGPQRVVIGMTSTQLKKARKWLSLATSIKLQGPNGPYTPPLFSHIYELSTCPENNDKGSWYGWRIENAGLINQQPLVIEARETVKFAKSSSPAMLPPPEEHDDLPGQ